MTFTEQLRSVAKMDLLMSFVDALETQRNFLRLLTYETPLDPREWFAQTVQPSSA